MFIFGCFGTELLLYPSNVSKRYILQYKRSTMKTEQENNNQLRRPKFLSDKQAHKIDDHIEKTIGKTGLVYHEIMSDLIHVDIYKIDPTKERNYYTLVTVGMSALPMKTPNKKYSPYLELMISLPHTWKLEEKDLEDENNYWPIRKLKETARFPFMYGTWLGVGHSIPNGNPPEQFSDNCPYTGIILLPSLLHPRSWTCKISPFKKIDLLAIHPLYTSEMDYKVEQGMSSFFDTFSEHNVSEIVDIERKDITRT